MAQVVVEAHKPHPITGGTYTVILPPRGKRSYPITFTVDDEELGDLRDALVGETLRVAAEHV